MAFLARGARAAVLTVLLVVVPAGRLLAQTPQQANEYQVKAAIVYSLLKFVEWPSDAFVSAAAPVSICVIGADPFGALMDDAVRGRQAMGRPIVIRRVTDVVPGCHVLFISISESRRLPVILDLLAASSVLTVSEQDGFVDRGGMIEMRNERDRVAFKIGIEAAERARLRLSARLLSLGLQARPARGTAR